MSKAVKITLFIIFLLPAYACSLGDDKYDDGPYIFIEKTALIEKSIVAGQVATKESSLSTRVTSFQNELSIFDQVTKVAALSDIHGQHDVFIHILKSHHIVDEDLNWSFGDGHFVITGDIFDRGPQVLETLWFIYDLEKQAAQQGGKVHYLLGNHEYMVLRGDTRYLHKNHLKTSELLNAEYKTLFDTNTVLGQWIRSKSTIIKINRSLFLHGGLSHAFLEQNLDLDKANEHFRDTIGLKKDELIQNHIYKALHAPNGPIWYRGYFKDGGLSNADVNIILERFDADRIVVGHTSQSEIRQLNDGRIYAIDSSIKKGLGGEILILSGEDAYRGTYDGSQIKLNDTSKKY